MRVFECGSKSNMGNRTLMRLDFLLTYFGGKQSTYPNHTKIVISEAAEKLLPKVPPKREGLGGISERS